jgi:hypothetical protein
VFAAGGGGGGGFEPDEGGGVVVPPPPPPPPHALRARSATHIVVATNVFAESDLRRPLRTVSRILEFL